jgi:hypothetical protein
MGLLDFAEVGLFLWYVFILFGYFKYFYWKSRSHSWPTVPGSVQKGELVGGNSALFGMHRGIMGFAYSIEGVRYAGIFVVIANDENTAARYQCDLDGAQVSVRYDPNRPERSFLEQNKIHAIPIYQNPFWIE